MAWQGYPTTCAITEIGGIKCIRKRLMKFLLEVSIKTGYITLPVIYGAFLESTFVRL